MAYATILMRMTKKRAYSLILKCINKLQLDLSEMTVLTELGSGNYVFTPIIAALAGAKKIYAWTRDSSYGTAEQNMEDCKNMISEYGIHANRIEFGLNRNLEHVKEADIITNLGFVRPISREMIAVMKKSSVIPYMCEAWEIREGDVDIVCCIENKIKVAGTWENHPDLKIFDGCGPLGVKLAHQAGFEIYQNRICILSDDHFGKVIAAAYKKMGAEEIILLKPREAGDYDFDGIDFILVTDYSSSLQFLGSQGLLKDNAIPIVHLCGAIDYDWAIKHEFSVYPRKHGHAKRMTMTLADLGMKPVIDLHTAGLKVGLELYKNKITTLSQPINF